MVFLVLYKAGTEPEIISVHVGVNSVVRSARGYIVDQRGLKRDDIPIVSCGVNSEIPETGFYLLRHDINCECGKSSTLELYEITPGKIWGTNTTLVETYKWGNSKF